MTRVVPTVLLVGLALWPVTPTLAQRLPVRVYSAADGLAGDDVHAILQDVRGFLWIGTTTGLSRFDGREFRTYGTADGLPHPWVHDLTEGPDGTIWIATGGGLARLDAEARTFATVRLHDHHARAVRRLYRDSGGTLWATAGQDLVALAENGDEIACLKVPLPTDPPADSIWEIDALAGSEDGTLWIGTTWGLVERRPDGRLIPWRIRPTTHDDRVQHLAVDGDGRVWVTHWGIAHRPNVNWALYLVDPQQTAAIPRGGDKSILLAGAGYATAGGPYGTRGCTASFQCEAATCGWRPRMASSASIGTALSGSPRRAASTLPCVSSPTTAMATCGWAAAPRGWRASTWPVS